MRFIHRSSVVVGLVLLLLAAAACQTVPEADQAVAGDADAVGEFQAAQGPVKVWTTFSADQADLNGNFSQIFSFTDRNGGGNNPATAFPSLSHNKIMAHSIRGRVTTEPWFRAGAAAAATSRARPGRPPVPCVPDPRRD